MLRPRFKRCFRAVAAPPDGVMLLSEGAPILLRGDVYLALAPLLDGERTIHEIFASLPDRFPSGLVFAALDHLRRQGWLADETGGVAREHVAFWEALGVDMAAAQARMAATVVAVGALGPIDGGSLIELLGGMGIRAAALAAEPDETAAGRRLDVILTDDYLRPEIREQNRRALAAERPWILARPSGVELWLGPLFVPGRTGCWACLAHRLAGHRRAEGWLQRRRATDDPFTSALSALPSTRQTALGVVATEAARWVIAGAAPTLEGKVVSLDARTLDRREHALARRPQCPACGEIAVVDPRAPPPIRLGPQPKRFVADGGHRAATPEETFERLRRHISPITGVVATLDEQEDEGGGDLHTFFAQHAFAEIDAEPGGLRNGIEKRSGGKGAGRAQARASALGEAVERYSGVFQGDEPRFRAARADLGDAAVHPDAFMGFSQRQYRERERLNAEGSRARWVPEPFDDARPVEWTALRSLSDGAVRYLPTACCYYGHLGDDGRRYAVANSNGCAAGNTVEEAVLQGLLELVERDAVALWWYNRVRRPGVDLASFDEPYVARLSERYRSLGRDLWALDITSDLGVPAFAAISRRLGGEAEAIVLGFGAHLDARIALLRALTEASQSLPAVEPPSPGAPPPYAGAVHETARWWREARLDDQPHLAPDPGRPASKRGDRAIAGDDIAADVMRCVRILAGKGMETLVLDQTRADVGLPVVRVVVPGLRHFWPRFGPGRLYDVPVAEGWLPRPLDEGALNPWIVYF